MAAVVNTGMTKPDMKKMIKRAKAGEIGCAVGQGDNTAYSLLLMHPTKTGSAIETLLKAECNDVKKPRHGVCHIDVKADKKEMVFKLKGAASSGTARKLIKTLKGTGVTKVRLLGPNGEPEELWAEPDDTDPGDEDDLEDAVAASPTADAAAEAAAQPGAAADASGEMRQGTAPAPPKGPAPPVQPAQTAEQRAAVAAELAKQLAAIAPTIPAAAGGDDTRKALLLKFATDVNVNIKTGNLKIAAAALENLKAELRNAGGGPASRALADARKTWEGAQKDVAAEVEKLRAALDQTYAGQPYAGEIAAKFSSAVAPVLAKFDGRVADAMEKVAAETDSVKRSEAAFAARAVIKEYLSFAMTDKLIADLDANPFVPLTIRPKMTAALAGFAAAVK